jgi:putative spermidine/putrescine transport system permease protein
MSSSSGSEGEAPRLDVEEIEEAERILEQEPPKVERALGQQAAAGRSREGGLITAAWATPGSAWLLFFLVAPLVMIVLVSFWTQTVSGFDKWNWTLHNYGTLFHDATYWNQLKQSFFNSLIVTGATLVLGFPIAYFLAFKVQSLRNQIALFIIALAPFWTSYLIRAIAWSYPLMGRQGAINTFLQKIGVIDQPLGILAFSNFSVVLFMIQLYVLFMITPLFFMLSQVDRSSLEAARDLGASWFKSFREVILPQAMPGVVIGSIFIFVLSMGEYGTVRIVGGNSIASVGTIVQNQFLAVEFPTAATSAIFLVLAMMAGIFVLLRFSNLREEL